MSNKHIVYCENCGKKIDVDAGKYIGGGGYICNNRKCEYRQFPKASAKELI